MRQISNLPQLRTSAATGTFLHNTLHAVAHLAGGGGHTETELSVVLKQRVGPGGTEAAAVVLAIGGGRSRAAVDGGAARGVGHHHLLAEELGDALEVRGLAAAGAGAAELEQGLCELYFLFEEDDNSLISVVFFSI